MLNYYRGLLEYSNVIFSEHTYVAAALDSALCRHTHPSRVIPPIIGCGNQHRGVRQVAQDSTVVMFLNLDCAGLQLDYSRTTWFPL